MKNNYPYLRDPRSLSKIRKHQWIESQKMGREIGFGTAAVDWISKYGEAWRSAHVGELKDRMMFIEQRKYRRFELESKAMLVYGEQELSVRTIDISCQGLLCKIKKHLDVGCHLGIRWPLGQDAANGLQLKGAVERASRNKDEKGEYLLLVKFDEETRKKIERFEFLIKQ